MKAPTDHSTAALPAGIRQTLAELPALLVHGGALVRSRPDAPASARIARPDVETARDDLIEAPHLLCHGRALGRQLGIEHAAGLDLLELFAFVRPARFCLPTVRGLARSVGLLPDSDDTAGTHDPETLLALMPLVAAALLSELAVPLRADRDEAVGIATVMAAQGWAWGGLVLRALGVEEGAPDQPGGYRVFAVWQRAPEWPELSPPPPPGSEPVAPPEARARLDALLESRGGAREARPQQADYASAIAGAFGPRPAEGQPQLLLAEAGTGVGKTLGYLAPASLWAARNEAPVWIATYTRNLQRQIDDELQRLTALIPADSVVIRKGRENFLCLLNFEEAIQRLATTPRNAVPLGLLTRWAFASRDGALIAGDLPGWLADLVGRNRTQALADRRGECIYAACPHFRRCYVERNARAAKYARIVVANHALVLYQAATSMQETPENAPTHLVFDEGHHLFDAADAAFAVALTGLEAAEQRRWLLGEETGRSSRARGLARRVEDLLAGDEEGGAALDAVREAARALPGQGWQKRLAGSEGQQGAGERFFAGLRQHVHRHAGGRADSFYDLEAAPLPADPALIEAASEFARALDRLIEPLNTIRRRLSRLLDERAEDWDSGTRQRAEAQARAIRRRVEQVYRGWRAGLLSLIDRAILAERLSSASANDNPPAGDPALLAASADEGFIDWFGVSRRSDGHELDVGYYRHWIDPTRPLAETVLRHCHGVVLTSATLTDDADQGRALPDAGGEDVQQRIWQRAEQTSGAAHLPGTPVRVRVRSPFDYASQTRVLIITDVNRNDTGQVAGAYRALFEASAGGALGLFTAIQRLRAVHQRLAPALATAGLPLYAQHVDGLDPATLVDIFRAERQACLLGTDAIRDGVDVPGDALRLVVFDRVPWPRASLLHKARRRHFGGQDYDDALIRLRLRQAFGRLVRRADDRGVFVMLDSAFPSRLLGAFPEGVQPVRLGLAAAVAEIHQFMKNGTAS